MLRATCHASLDLADMCTSFQALAEFDSHLPLDVAADPAAKQCRCSSPAITAHDALLRPVEHSTGCRWSD